MMGTKKRLGLIKKRIKKFNSNSIQNLLPFQKNKIFFIFSVVIALSLMIVPPCMANHLTIENFNVYKVDTATNTITYSCDISWKNSWRNPINYDAVWVFLKYSINGGATWSHASMSAFGKDPMGFTPPTYFEIVVPNDEKGFFLQRTDLLAGDVSAEDVRFVWDYEQDGLTDSQAVAANTINKIFGIEMVYIPQGAFYAGDGDSSSPYRFVQGTSDNEPWYITSEAAITTTNDARDGYYYQNTGASGESISGSLFLIPSSFPKGYQAYYLMKYELTEGQWVGFFNTLTTTEKASRDVTGSSEGGKNSDGVVKRNTISWDDTDAQSSATTNRPDRPVSFISWPDLLAYSDWAGLRPFTELEFEKAARGTDITPVADEFAWGTTAMNQAASGDIYPNTNEDGTERILDGTVNVNRNSLAWTSGDGRPGGEADGQTGPLRAGIFAKDTTSRVTSGSGYYGGLELSGNLHEMVVTVGRNNGRQFLGTHGDGQLSAVSGYEGNATNLDWPGLNSFDAGRGVTDTTGMGFRGGDFQSSSIRHFQVSTRTFAAKDPDSQGAEQRFDAGLGVIQGGRLGRTASNY